MKSGMTLGKFGAFMAAFTMWVGGAWCITYEVQPMAWVCFLGGFFLGVWVIGDASWERHNDELQYRTYLVQERTKFAMSIAPLSSSQLQLIGLEYPELGIDFGVVPIVYVLKNGMNTGLMLVCFQQFLRDSTESAFADERRYNDDKHLQKLFGLSREQVRKQWQVATDYLLEIGYLLRGSMAGNQTYQWKSKGHYRKITRQYAVTPHFENLSNEQKAESGA
jgi:hypothetical protein